MLGTFQRSIKFLILNFENLILTRIYLIKWWCGPVLPSYNLLRYLPLSSPALLLRYLPLPSPALPFHPLPPSEPSNCWLTYSCRLWARQCQGELWVAGHTAAQAAARWVPDPAHWGNYTSPVTLPALFSLLSDNLLLDPPDGTSRHHGVHHLHLLRHQEGGREDNHRDGHRGQQQRGDHHGRGGAYSLATSLETGTGI